MLLSLYVFDLKTEIKFFISFFFLLNFLSIINRNPLNIMRISFSKEEIKIAVVETFFFVLACKFKQQFGSKSL